MQDFLAYDASHSFFTHAPKKKKRLSPPPPSPNKKQTKGLGYKQCSFWEKSSPVSSQHLISAQQQEQAGLLWNAEGESMGAGVRCGGRSSPMHGMLTVDTGCAQT